MWRSTESLLKLLGALFVFAIALHAEQLPLQTYTTAEGLPHNEINRIVKDSRGFLWFCTAEGLSRFDGYTFRNYGTHDGLPDGNVTDFLESSSGELWIATRSGLVLFNPKGSNAERTNYSDETRDTGAMFKVLLPDDVDRRARFVTVLLQGRDGTIWVGTWKGLFRVERSDGRYHLLRVDLPATVEPIVLDLLEDRRGSLWIASFSGLFRRWPDGSTSLYTKSDGLPDVNIHDLFEDHQGRLWASTRLAGFFLFEANETHARPIIRQAYRARDGLTTDWVSQILETSNRQLWVATNRGVAEFFPDAVESQARFKTYTQRNGLLYYGVNTLGEDFGGNLWMGTDAGAMKLARGGFITYGEKDGLMTVSSIFGGGAGDVCFRASIFYEHDVHVGNFDRTESDSRHPSENYHTRFGCFDGHQFTWLKPDVLADSQLGWVGEMVTLQSRGGEWWLGTGEGVYRFKSTENFARLKQATPLAVYSTKDGLAAPQVFRLFEDSRNNIWVSTIEPNGLAQWERVNERWHDLTNSAGLPSPKDDLARAFGEDRDGNIWIGFNTGVARYSNGRFTFFPATDNSSARSVMNFYLSSEGQLWLSSARNGLIRVDNPSAAQPTFVRYTTDQGLSSNSTEAITDDLAGHVYVSTGRGIDRLDPKTGSIKHFTTADGLAPGEVKAAFRAHDGALWFGTSKGLSRFVPGSTTSSSGAPPIVITAMSISGERLALSALGETRVALPDLASDRNQLQVEFVGLSFVPGEVLRYQYKLENTDRDWTIPVEARSVNYARLAPGAYTFLVRAVNSDGVVSENPAIVQFTILAPIWRRWWFTVLIAFVVGASVFAVYRYRVQRLIELERVRTSIATDLHDDIGANLTRIAILSEVAQQRLGHLSNNADDLLPSIAKISRESVSSMGDIVWAINPNKDTLEDLIRRMRDHAREILERRDILLRFSTSELTHVVKLNANKRRGIYLIFKEALNNVIRHSRTSIVYIELKISEAELFLCITDEGAGFDVGLEYDGNGLLSMKKRAADLKARLEIDSAVGQGTRTCLRVPL